jgi:hypothetical protein
MLDWSLLADEGFKLTGSIEARFSYRHRTGPKAIEWK